MFCGKSESEEKVPESEKHYQRMRVLYQCIHSSVRLPIVRVQYGLSERDVRVMDVTRHTPPPPLRCIDCHQHTSAAVAGPVPNRVLAP